MSEVLGGFGHGFDSRRLHLNFGNTFNLLQENGFGLRESLPAPPLCWTQSAQFRLRRTPDAAPSGLPSGTYDLPQQVLGLTGAKDISSGFGHSCAVTAGARILCWGTGQAGEFGLGDYDSSSTPVTVLDPYD